MKKEVIWLTELEEDLDLVGGKAFNLMKMVKLGLPVPEGFVITTNNLTDEVKIEIKRNFYKLLQIYDSVSIRSSANVEDSEKASFAGLFETFLHVNTENKLFSSIERCFDSVNNPGIKIYSEKKSIDPKKIKMNVIVQGMINTDKGGVIFTKDIWNNHKNSLLIEVSRGLGENVVSGNRIPSRFVIQKESGKILKKSVNGTQLNSYEISELLRHIKLLEEHFGFPQDIEWGLKDGKAYFLQTRPIPS